MDIKINWVKYLKLSEGSDEPRGICLFGDYVVVGGNASNRPSIVLLDRNTGEVVKTWIGNNIGSFKDCLSVNGKLYIVGSEEKDHHDVGTIYVFDSELNVQKKIEASVGINFSFIDSDGNHLYIAGTDKTDEWKWYVEERTLNLELIKYKKPHYGGVAIMRVNPITGELWMIGYSDSEAISVTLVIIFDKELGRVKRVEYLESEIFHSLVFPSLRDICFDDLGNAYATGYDGIIKFDKHGNILATSKSIRAEQIVCIGNFIYTFTNPEVDGYHRHVLCVLDSKLKVVEEYILSMNVNANSYFSSKHSCDGRNMYVAGYDTALGEEKCRWVIYSILVPTETGSTDSRSTHVKNYTARTDAQEKP